MNVCRINFQKQERINVQNAKQASLRLEALSKVVVVEAKPEDPSIKFITLNEYNLRKSNQKMEKNIIEARRDSAIDIKTALIKSKQMRENSDSIINAITSSIIPADISKTPAIVMQSEVAVVEKNDSVDHKDIIKSRQVAKKVESNSASSDCALSEPKEAFQDEFNIVMTDAFGEEVILPTASKSIKRGKIRNTFIKRSRNRFN